MAHMHKVKGNISRQLNHSQAKLPLSPNRYKTYRPTVSVLALIFPFTLYIRTMLHPALCPPSDQLHKAVLHQLRGGREGECEGYRSNGTMHTIVCIVPSFCTLSGFGWGRKEERGGRETVRACCCCCCIVGMKEKGEGIATLSLSVVVVVGTRGREGRREGGLRRRIVIIGRKKGG